MGATKIPKSLRSLSGHTKDQRRNLDDFFFGMSETNQHPKMCFVLEDDLPQLRNTVLQGQPVGQPCSTSPLTIKHTWVALKGHCDQEKLISSHPALVDKMSPSGDSDFGVGPPPPLSGLLPPTPQLPVELWHGLIAFRLAACLKDQGRKERLLKNGGRQGNKNKRPRFSKEGNMFRCLSPFGKKKNTTLVDEIKPTSATHLFPTQLT